MVSAEAVVVAFSDRCHLILAPRRKKHGRRSRDAWLNPTPFAPYWLCRCWLSLLYLVILEAAHIRGIHAWKSQSGGKQLVSSSLCWSMMSSDIVVFHLCCLDPLRFTPPPHPTISISCRHTARIYTNLCVIWIYFPQMLFVSEFMDICNLSWTYQKL